MFSLRTFHILFVTVAMLSMLAIGVASVVAYLSHHQTDMLAMAVTALVVTVGLVVYGAWFLGKVNRMRLS